MLSKLEVYNVEMKWFSGSQVLTRSQLGEICLSIVPNPRNHRVPCNSPFNTEGITRRFTFSSLAALSEKRWTNQHTEKLDLHRRLAIWTDATEANGHAVSDKNGKYPKTNETHYHFDGNVFLHNMFCLHLLRGFLVDSELYLAIRSLSQFSDDVKPRKHQIKMRIRQQQCMHLILIIQLLCLHACK